MSDKRKMKLYETITHYTAASKRNDTRKRKEKKKKKKRRKMIKNKNYGNKGHQTLTIVT